jgi:hypothetical protein
MCFDSASHWAAPSSTGRGTCVGSDAAGKVMARQTLGDKAKLWFDGVRLMLLKYQDTGAFKDAKVGEPEVRRFQDGKITGVSSGEKVA